MSAQQIKAKAVKNISGIIDISTCSLSVLFIVLDAGLTGIGGYMQNYKKSS
jgi:hypothetical protein